MSCFKEKKFSNETSLNSSSVCIDSIQRTDSGRGCKLGCTAVSTNLGLNDHSPLPSCDT